MFRTQFASIIRNNSYTGFILYRTYDTHQWLPLQFCKLLLMMDAKLRPKHVVIKNQINRKSCISLVFI